MPAPVPVVIQHGDPTSLGQLAGAAGGSEFAYNDMIRRMAMDREFLNQEANRRAEDTWRQNDLAFKYKQLATEEDRRRGATELQDAYHTRNLDLEQRGQDLNYKSAQDRIAAQKAASVTSAAGRAKTPVQLVPEEGSLTPDAGNVSASIRSSDGSSLERTRGGDVTQYGAGGSLIPMPAISGQTATPKMVTPNVRSQLDYLRSFDGHIDPDVMNSMMVAARSGNLKMDQLVDDVRQATTEHSGRMSAEVRNLDRYKAEAGEIQAIGSLQPNDQVAYARRKFNMQDPDIYADEDAIKALKSRQNQLQAILKPVTNSSGSTPTGGNIVSVQTPDQARSLPSGTYFKTPDGRIKRVP